MNPVSKFRQWLALRKARQEEQKNLPSMKQIKKEQKVFTDEAKELKDVITKKRKPRKQRKNI